MQVPLSENSQIMYMYSLQRPYYICRLLKYTTAVCHTSERPDALYTLQLLISHGPTRHCGCAALQVQAMVPLPSLAARANYPERFVNSAVQNLPLSIR